LRTNSRRKKKGRVGKRIKEGPEIKHNTDAPRLKTDSKVRRRRNNDLTGPLSGVVKKNPGRKREASRGEARGMKRLAGKCY